MRNLGVYFHYALIGFLELLAYRVTVVMLAFSIPVILFARYFVFAALYKTDGQTVEGYSLQGILTYLAVAWILRSFFRSGTDRRIGRSVREGDIVFDLLRPVDYHALTFFRSFGKSLNRFLLVSLPMILILAGTDLLAPPAGFGALVAFLFAVAIAYVLAFETQFFIGILAFFTGYNINIIWTFDMIVQILAGLLLPIHFFPEAARRVIEWMPFRHIYYTPVQLYMGQIDAAHAPELLAEACLWTLAFGGLNWIVYRAGRNRLAIAGG